MEKFLKDFLDFVKIERGYSENTVNSYRRDLDQFQKYVGKSGMRGVGRGTIKDYLEHLYDKGFSVSSTAIS